MTRDVDAFLEAADDAIDDWESSPDVASWSADGSHEHDTDGHYYLNQQRPPLSDELWHGVPIIVAGRGFCAPIGTPLPTTPPPAPDRFSQVRIEVTSPDGEVVEFEVPRARFTIDRQTQFADDDPDEPWVRLPIRRIADDRVQFTIEPVPGVDGVQYEVHHHPVASADG